MGMKKKIRSIEFQLSQISKEVGDRCTEEIKKLQRERELENNGKQHSDSPDNP